MCVVNQREPVLTSILVFKKVHFEVDLLSEPCDLLSENGQKQQELTPNGFQMLLGLTKVHFQVDILSEPCDLLSENGQKQQEITPNGFQMLLRFIKSSF